MMKKLFVFCVLSIYILKGFAQGSTDVPSKWLCANDNCDEVVATASVVRPYTPDHKDKLTLAYKNQVNVLAFPENSDGSHLLYVEVNGRKGYIPNNLVKIDRQKVKKSSLLLVERLVDQALIPKKVINKNPSSDPTQNIQPTNSKVFVDGTAIPKEAYDDDDDDVGVDVEDAQGLDSSETEVTNHVTPEPTQGLPSELDQGEKVSNVTQDPAESRKDKEVNLTGTDGLSNDGLQVNTQAEASKGEVDLNNNAQEPSEASSDSSKDQQVQNNTQDTASYDSMNNGPTESNTQDPPEAPYDSSKDKLTNPIMEDSTGASFTSEKDKLNSMVDDSPGAAHDSINDAPMHTQTPTETIPVNEAQTQNNSQIPSESSDPDNAEQTVNTTSVPTEIPPNPTYFEPTDNPSQDSTGTPDSSKDEQIMKQDFNEAPGNPVIEDQYTTPDPTEAPEPINVEQADNQTADSTEAPEPINVEQADNQTADSTATADISKDEKNTSSLMQDPIETSSVPYNTDKINSYSEEPTEVPPSKPYFYNNNYLPREPEEPANPEPTQSEYPTVTDSPQAPPVYSYDSTEPTTESPYSSYTTTYTKSPAEESTYASEPPPYVEGSPSHGDGSIEPISVPLTTPETPVISKDIVEDQGGNESGSNLFSSISSVMDSIRDLFASSPIPETVPSSEPITERPPSFPESSFGSEDGSCSGDDCSTIASLTDDSNMSSEPTVLNSDSVMSMFFTKDFPQYPSAGMLLISLVVLVFSLGYYYIVEYRREGDLVGQLNVLGRELFVVKKAKEELESKLATIETDGETRNLNYKSLLETKTVECSELQEMVNKLEIRVNKQNSLIANLRKSNQDLMQNLSAEEGKEVLQQKIDKLKEALTQTVNDMLVLKQESADKTNKLDELQLELQRHLETEKNYQNLRTEFEEKCKEFEHEIRQKELEIEKKVNEETNLESDLMKYKKRCESLLAKNISLDKALKEAHNLNNSSVALSDWLQVADIRSALASSDLEIKNLKDQLDKEIASKQSLNNELEEVKLEIVKLHDKIEVSEKAKMDALTRLEVLSKYFNEKEVQLHEELGMKEALLQEVSKGETIYDEMRSLKDEIDNLKAQNDQLRKEIVDQEVSFKARLSTEEKKSNEHWVSLRQMERRLKDEQMEAAALRTRLTRLETSTVQNSSGELNGDASVGEPSGGPFMLPPGFDPHFIPPPPLPAGADVSGLAPSSRPPPLGRISSPPIPPDFIPPPPLIPPPPILTTANMGTMYRPTDSPPTAQPLRHPHDWRRRPDSPPSPHYSSESPSDKPSRSSRR